MIDDLQMSSEGLGVRMFQQEVIANNLANVNTVGFKRDKVFLEELEAASQTSEETVHQTTIFEQGPVKETGNPFDLALVGEGFFVVQTEAGVRYGRNGHFERDVLGQLVVNGTQPVLGENGPIQVTDTFTVNEAGEIFNGEQFVDRLRLVTFDQPFPLRKEGHSLFALTDETAVELPSDQLRVKQGFLEGSNVNPIEEMVDMLLVYRYFEAEQKMLLTQDNLLEQAANDIGQV